MRRSTRETRNSRYHEKNIMVVWIKCTTRKMRISGHNERHYVLTENLLKNLKDKHQYASRKSLLGVWIRRSTSETSNSRYHEKNILLVWINCSAMEQADRKIRGSVRWKNVSKEWVSAMTWSRIGMPADECWDQIPTPQEEHERIRKEVNKRKGEYGAHP